MMYPTSSMSLLPSAYFCLLLLWLSQTTKSTLTAHQQLVSTRAHFPMLIVVVAVKPWFRYFVATTALSYISANPIENTELSHIKKESISRSYNSTAVTAPLTKKELDELRSQFESLSPLLTERISYAIVYGIIIVLSAVGNALVCNVCFKNMTKTNALIMSLAVSDLLMTVFNIPFNYFRLLNYSWPFGSAMCFLVNFMQHLVVYISSYTMAIIAIQRYRSVCGLPLELNSSQAPRVSVDRMECRFASQNMSNWCKRLSKTASAQLVACCPFKFNWFCKRNKKKKLFSKRAICSSIVLTWILSALISILFTYTSSVVAKEDAFALLVNYHYQMSLATSPNFTMDTNEHSMHVVLRCQNKMALNVENFLNGYSVNAEFAKTMLVFVTQYFIPLSISCCLYVRIGKIITRQGQIATLRGNPKARIRQKKKRRRIVMLVLVVTVFALTWAPLHVFHILIDTGLLNYNYEIFMVVHWLAMSSVCYNPFIYCWLNRSFRKAAMRVFCCCCVEEEFASISAEDNPLDRIAHKPTEENQTPKRFFDKVPCCGCGRRPIQPEQPPTDIDRPSPTTPTSQLPVSTENGFGPRAFLCTHMHSNFSVATESSVIAGASIERLADLDAESENNNQMQITLLPLNKNKTGLTFVASKWPRSSSAVPSTGTCQINVQDCSHICASSTSELSFRGECNDLCPLPFESAYSRLNSPEEDDDAVLNEKEHHRESCHSCTLPLEMRPITRSAALFGGMDGYNLISSQETHGYSSNSLKPQTNSQSDRSRKPQKLMLTTDL